MIIKNLIIRHHHYCLSSQHHVLPFEVINILWFMYVVTNLFTNLREPTTPSISSSTHNQGHQLAIHVCNWGMYYVFLTMVSDIPHEIDDCKASQSHLYLLLLPLHFVTSSLWKAPNIHNNQWCVNWGQICRSKLVSFSGIRPLSWRPEGGQNDYSK